MHTVASPKHEFGAVWRYEGKRGTVWRIRYTDAAGRRVLETLGKEPQWTRKRAQAELRRRQVDTERDGYRHPEKTLFRDFAASWSNDYLPGRGLKQTTLESYNQTLERHLLPYFGNTTLHDLEQRPELIDRYTASKIQAGLAPKTVTNHLLLLQVMLKRAVRWRLIRHNPVAEADRPRSHATDMNVLTEVEIARLWTAYQQLEQQAASPEAAWWNLARTLTYVALGTGMRRGELLALRWRNIHLLDNTIEVREALVRGRFTTPKSQAGHRPIQLGPRTHKLLSDHWRTSAYQADDDLVFHHPTKGTPIDPARLARTYLRPALHTAGITKPFRPFHDLRHTALTHDAAAGNPMSYIQAKAGHSQASVTERYIHAAQLTFPGAAARTEERMFGTAHAHEN